MLSFRRYQFTNSVENFCIDWKSQHSQMLSPTFEKHILIASFHHHSPKDSLHRILSFHTMTTVSGQYENFFLLPFFFNHFWLPATCCQFSGICSDNFIWGMLTQDQIMLMDFIKGGIQLPKCRHLMPFLPSRVSIISAMNWQIGHGPLRIPSLSGEPGGGLAHIFRGKP